MANEMSDRLVELIRDYNKGRGRISPENLADYLIADGWIRPPCKIGQPVYFVCEDDEDYFISENRVTDVSSKGFFVSNYDPPQDDLGYFELYEVIGDTAFFNKEEAKKKLKEIRYEQTKSCT